LLNPIKKEKNEQALIQWNNHLSVNVVEIDRQLQKLVGMNNELNDAMPQRKGKDALGNIITGLVSCTAPHFQTEKGILTNSITLMRPVTKKSMPTSSPRFLSSRPVSNRRNSGCPSK